MMDKQRILNGIIERDERIVSLKRTVGEQADQIGGLTSELERAKTEAKGNWVEVVRLRARCEAAEQQLAASQADTKQVMDDYQDMGKEMGKLQAEAAALRTEHLWAKRLINCWWAAEQPQHNDVANPEGFDKLENKTAVAIERWKEAVKAAEDALATPSAAAERVQALEEVAKAARRYRYWRNKYLDEPKVTSMSPARAFEDVEIALAALDAATGEEVKGE